MSELKLPEDFNDEDLFREVFNQGYEQGMKGAAFKWTPVSEGYPKKKGEYLVTYHPCYWDNVEDDVKEVGIDSFRGKESWAKSKYQKVIAWAEKPEPWGGE